MGVAPDLGAEVDGWEDGHSVYLDVVKDVGAEGSDKGKRMGVKVGNTGDVAKKVPFNELLLGNPKFLAVVVNNGVLMGVAVDGEGTCGGGEEVGEDVS